MEIGIFALLSAGAFAGALVQAATGFGFAILAAPVFLAVLSSHAALQVLVVIHLFQTARMLPKLWPQVPKPLLGRLVLGALVGSPIGLVAFLHLSVTQLKLAVGVLIVLATALLAARESGIISRWLKPPTSEMPGPSGGGGLGALATGAVAGAMTALLVMPGPPLMLYISARPLPPLAARALAIAFFGLCYLLVTTLNVIWAELGWPVWRVALMLAPAVLLGTFAGERIAGHLTTRSYRLAVLILLALSGLGAMLAAL